MIIGLTWGGSTYAWNSGTIIGTLVAGCVGLVVFGLFEYKIKTSNGILDHRLFDTLNFPVLCFVCMVDGMLLLGINVLYSQEIADLFSNDAIRIAVILIPYLITSTAGCLPAGWIMGKTQSYRILLIAALLWCSLFTGLMGLVDASKLKMAFAFSALFGIGTAVTTVVPSMYVRVLSRQSYTDKSNSCRTRSVGPILPARYGRHAQHLVPCSGWHRRNHDLYRDLRQQDWGESPSRSLDNCTRCWREQADTAASLDGTAIASSANRIAQSHRRPSTQAYRSDPWGSGEGIGRVVEIRLGRHRVSRVFFLDFSVS